MNKYLKYLSVAMLTVILYACPSGGSKKTTGDDFFKTKNYHSAAEKYLDEYMSAPKDSVQLKAKLAFLLGESYKYSGKLAESERWYKEAIAYDIIPEAKFGYGDVLKRNGKYYQAIDVFQEYLEENVEDKHRADYAILGCERALEYMEAPSEEYELYKPQNFNSKYSDYAPSYYGNNIVFSSHRNSSTGPQIYGKTGEQFSDLYISRLDGEGRPQPPTLLDENLFPINTKQHEGASTFSSDSTEIFFTRCGDEDKRGVDYCQIYYSKKMDDGTFSEPVVVQFFDDSTVFNVGQPSLSPDGMKLYFSAEVPYKGYGGRDIYYVERIAGQWSRPENLGPIINTPGDEKFPFAYKDDKIYFSSDGHVGMGGMDIFEAERKGNKWRIRNMKYPMNTGADDFGLVLQDNEVLNESGYYVTRGFFSSSRKDGLGSDDIYGLRMKKDAFYFLNVVVLEKVYMNPGDTKSKIIDLAPIRNTKVQIYANDTLVEIGKTNESGILRYKLKPNKEYKVLATKMGFLNQSEYVPSINYNTSESNKIIHVDLELIMDQSFGKQFIKIENIYYDFDAWYIREDAAYELDSLSNLLKDNPQLAKVEIGSHTDSRGSYAYNEKLSQKRAESCVRYMVSKGIDKNRLIAKGYGESELTNNCDDAHECSEAEHQRNRRTTFRIITEDYDIVSVDASDIFVDESATQTAEERDKKRISDDGWLELFGGSETTEETPEEDTTPEEPIENNSTPSEENTDSPIEEDMPPIIESNVEGDESLNDILNSIDIVEDDTPDEELGSIEETGEFLPDDGLEPETGSDDTKLPGEKDAPIKTGEEMLDENGDVIEDENEGTISSDEAGLIDEPEETLDIEPSADEDTTVSEDMTDIFIPGEDAPSEDIIEEMEAGTEDFIEETNTDAPDVAMDPDLSDITDLDSQYETEAPDTSGDEYDTEEDLSDGVLMIEEELMEETVLEVEIGAKFKEKGDYILVLTNEDTLINQLVDKDLYKLFTEGDKVVYTSSGMWGDFSITKKE